jgi:hypothetical protein
MDHFRPVQRGLNVGHEVFAANAVKKAASAEQFRGLLHGAAKQHDAARFVQSFGKGLDGMNPGGVDGRHIAQPQNDDRLKFSTFTVASTSFSVVPHKNGP